MKTSMKLNLAAGALFFIAVPVAFISGRASMLIDLPAVAMVTASEILRRRAR